MSEVAGSWTAALEALEADVDALNRALVDGKPVVVTSWESPSGLGPIPEVLAPRAKQLVDRIAEVQRHGRERMAVLQGELSELDRRRDASVAYSSAGSPDRN